jgi:hypothetical protein
VDRRWKRLLKRGELAPVVVAGRTIAHTFWGAAWCTNLERYSDFANRLPRGRTYVRHRAVQHLEIAAGRVQALVRGSWLYEVSIAIAPIPKARWNAICRDSVGAIDSLIELLQGRFSTGVMERISRRDGGLFPAPREIQFGCSCPDWAHMCKHVAAVLYGVGARLDQSPELLFRLRQVDEGDLITRAGGAAPLARRALAKEKLLSGADLSGLFGLQMATAGGRTRATRQRGSHGGRPGPKPGRKKPRPAKPGAERIKAERTAGRCKKPLPPAS